MTTESPAVPACLLRPYSATPTQKGGTLIAESVTSLEEHRRLVCDPDAYRPERCPRCGCEQLHAHDFRTRVLDDGRSRQGEVIRRYLCASEECEATWRVLPAVIARHLHRTWDTVQAATSGPTKVPATTVGRWLGRLQLVAVHLLQLLCGSAEPGVLAVLDELPLDCRRGELALALAEGGVLSRRQRLQQLAVWVHRLQPGLRLM